MQGSGPTPRRRSQFSLRWLILIMIPLAGLLAVYGEYQRRRDRAINAYDRIFDKGIDLHYFEGTTHSVRFKHANVTDEDLSAFVPAFNGWAPTGFGNTICLELKGSRVSDEAIAAFSQAVPGCKVIP